MRSASWSARRALDEKNWKFHGACFGRDGNLYCVPCNAERVLRVDDHGTLDWKTSWEEASTLARETGKKIFIEFGREL